MESVIRMLLDAMALQRLEAHSGTVSFVAKSSVYGAALC